MTTRTTTENSDIYLLKTSDKSAEGYHQILKGNFADDPLPGDQSTDIFIEGDVAYISGRFRNNILLSSGNQLIGSGIRDSFVVKVDKATGNVINNFSINCFDVNSEIHLEDIMIIDDYFYLSGHYKGSVLFDSTLKTSNTWRFYFWKKKNNL
jgi:hypothetical protein